MTLDQAIVNFRRCAKIEAEKAAYRDLAFKERNEAHRARSVALDEMHEAERQMREDMSRHILQIPPNAIII